MLQNGQKKKFQKKSKVNKIILKMKKYIGIMNFKNNFTFLGIFLMPLKRQQLSKKGSLIKYSLQQVHEVADLSDEKLIIMNCFISVFLNDLNLSEVMTMSKENFNYN